MKSTPPEQFRLDPDTAARMKLSAILGTTASHGMNGVFLVPRSGVILRCVVSDGGVNLPAEAQEWEHVSVSLPKRCPTWEEMSYVKDLFWNPEEVAMQLHPPKTEHVNQHPFCLHLWRHTRLTLPLPNSILVGIKT